MRYYTVPGQRWSNPFDYLGMAKNARTLKAVDRLLRAAQEKLSQAETVDWPALVASWKRDTDAIKSIRRRMERTPTKEQVCVTT